MQSHINIRLIVALTAVAAFGAAFCGMPARADNDSSDFTPVQRTALPKAVELPLQKIKDPSRLTVLLMPVLDEAGTNASLRQLRIGYAVHTAEYELISRHFTVLGPDIATLAATQSGLGDLKDPGNLTKDTLRKLADKTHADWVISLNLVDVKSIAPRPGDWTMTDTMHTEIYDAKRNGWLVDRDIVGIKKAGMELVGPLTMTEYTVPITTRQALATVVAPYTPVVTVQNEDRSYDYLSTQTKPFTGDPTKPFSGLNPALQ